MKLLSRLIPLGLIASCCLAIVSASLAHDGGFGHSRRLIYISPADGGLLLEYRIKQGAEEALVELIHADANQNGRISPEEREQFFTARGNSLLAKLGFRAAKTGEAIAAELDGFELHHSLVQVYRIRLPQTPDEVLLEDRNYPHKPGQVSIEVAAGLTAELTEGIDLSHADRVQVTLRKAAK